ncbi:PTS system, cellobiose-specific IIC component [Enterococcus sp. AZ135]|uniref:PTS sugar transporter subunit IIC n=1 Tax=unclassified Enterococcus TaxID=2608891 RepID=UPI003F22E2EC
MKKFIEWMQNDFSSKVNKIARNPWVAAIQDSLLSAMPMIFIGSFATILTLVKEYIPGFPDVTPISDFSFGLFSLFLAYLIPENVMLKKKHRNTSKQAGLAGLAFYLMIISPIFDEAGNMTIVFANLGAGGMVAALVAGIFVGFIMNLFAKFSFFKKDTTMPDFVTVWFNTLIPIIVILVVGWVFTIVLSINLFDLVYVILSPLISLGQSFWGFVLISFLGYAFFYTFGISSWIMYPVEIAIALPAISENMSAVANGNEPTNIFVNETLNIVTIGGGGSTLALCIMLAFLSKSQKNKLIGRTALIPSIFNINEPLIFGAPVAFNPILMIPMWIMGFLAPALTYLVMKIGLVQIPFNTFELWYIPTPIQAFFSTHSFMAVLYVFILFAISWIIYYPFFKIYDNQSLQEEGE